MNDKKRSPLNNTASPGTENEKEVRPENSDNPKTNAPHIGSSDAFLQTENTESPDADNISDEKLDELLDED